METTQCPANTPLVAVDGKLILGIWKNKSCGGRLYSFELANNSYIKIEHNETGKGVYSGTSVKKEYNVGRYEIGQYCLVEFELSNIPDGYYIYTNMPKNFRYETGYLKIQNGEIVGQWQWLADLLDSIKTPATI